MRRLHAMGMLSPGYSRARASLLAQRRPTRRTFLLGTAVGVTCLLAGGVAVQEDVMPGRPWAYRHLGLDGAAGVIPADTPGPMISGSFVSQRRGGIRCGWTICYPPAVTVGAGLPVAVILHGFAGDHTSAFGAALHLDRFLAQGVARGTPPFAVASVDGGNSYWHKRSNGEDAGAMLTEEFLPLLADKGLQTSRLGLLGYSMGGYGVLRLAGLLGPKRVQAVVAESPALWRHAADTAPRAFDDPADLAANTVFGRQHQLAGVAVRVDCGTGDGFYPAAKAYVDGFSTRPAGGFEPGGHDMAYWTRMAGPQLAFLGRSL